MCDRQLNVSGTPLGIVPLNFGVTINFPTGMLVKLGLKTKKFRWDCLTSTQQYAFMIDYIQEVYHPVFDSLEAYFEYTKQGMIHAHIHGVVYDACKDASQFWLQTIRARVQQSCYARRYLKESKIIMISNYIHEVDAVKWSEYVKKDFEKVRFKPLFFCKSNINASPKEIDETGRHEET